MPIRNPGLELGLAGDEVIVHVISLAAKPEMITQAEVQATADGPRERRALSENFEANALQLVVNVSTPDQELPEGPDPGRS